MKFKSLFLTLILVFAFVFTAGAQHFENPEIQALYDEERAFYDPNAISDFDLAVMVEGGFYGEQLNQMITTNGGQELSIYELSAYGGLGHLRYSDNASPVYYTSEITAEALVRLYQALNWQPEGKVAVKISTGESSQSNHLRPELIGDLVHLVDGTIVECNTAYKGNRSDSAEHYKLAEEHGYTAIAKVDIMDEEGMLSLPVHEGSVRLKENIVGSHFSDYGSFIILSHFKGHAMAGFGGAIKNTSIGVASAPDGKINIHTGGLSKTTFMDELLDPFQEAMAEATFAVSDALGGGKNIIYINVINRVSVDCDCNGNPAEPDIHDIGIMASYDPVALDQACVDITSKSEGAGTLMYRVAERHGLRSLEHGQELGLGTRNYYLVDIDK